MSKLEERLEAGAKNLVKSCGNVVSDEEVLVLCTRATRSLAERVARIALDCSKNTVLMELPEVGMHGNEPSQTVAGAMLRSDVIFGLTPMSLAHTNARKAASQTKSRYLSLPDYSDAVMSSPALMFDFKALRGVVEALGKILDQARLVRIITEAGSDVILSVEGRPTNKCPGYVTKIGDLGSPPDAEVNLAPVEGSAHGRLIVDGSVPCREVGVLPAPIALEFVGGRVVKVDPLEVSAKEAAIAIEALFDNAVGTGPGDPRMLGEFGIGLNPDSVLCGAMLEDEGAFGTAHFGIGSNATIGGLNSIPFHLDFIFKSPTIVVDGLTLMEKGAFAAFDTSLDLSIFQKDA